MLTEIYISALLADKELADQVYEAWNKGEIDDQVAWFLVSFSDAEECMVSGADLGQVESWFSGLCETVL